MAEFRDLVAKQSDLSANRKDLVARKQDLKGKFTPVSVAKWPGIWQAREIALDKGKSAYGPTEEHNMRGDAYRHLVLQALLAKKYGASTGAAITGYHESRMPTWLGGAGVFPDQDERAMDTFNNALGLEIASKANSMEDIFRLAKEYVDSGKAKSMSIADVIRKSKEEEGDQEAY